MICTTKIPQIARANGNEISGGWICLEMEYTIATRRVRRILDHVWESENIAAPIPDLSIMDSVSSSIEALKLAEPTCGRAEDQPVYSRISQPAISDGLVWSPRIDVAECCSYYIVIVELPGVKISEIKVVVDDQNLTVTGERLIQSQWRIMNFSRDSNLIYHRKEILQGPYEVNWALPKDIDRDQVSAEFVDGFLHITVPKVCKG